MLALEATTEESRCVYIMARHHLLGYEHSSPSVFQRNENTFIVQIYDEKDTLEPHFLFFFAYIIILYGDEAQLHAEIY